MRYLPLLTLIILSFTKVNSQCNADFIISENSPEFSFTNISQLEEGDEIISHIWRFGDGNTSLDDNPTYSYPLPGAYDVILEIATANGCNSSDTMLVEVCSIGLDYNIGIVCDEDGFLPVALTIDDLFNSLELVNIYLDDNIVNTDPVVINDLLNINISVPGDGNQHFIRVESALTDHCDKTIGFLVDNCNTNCFLSNLVINDGYHDTHNIVLLDSIFLPNNRIIELGDRVRFVWLTNNHSTTSEDTLTIDSWDSGIQDSAYVFEIVPKIPGIKSYYSIPDSQYMTGNLIANCPEDRGNIMQLKFTNASVPDAGFQIGLDGVPLNDEIHQYSQTGLTTVEFFLPGDANIHQVSIIDIEDPTCNVKQNVQAIHCQGEVECALAVTAKILDRCDQDSMVNLSVTVNNLKPTDAGVLIMVDDTLVMDTLYFTNGVATSEFKIFGDGLTHTIQAMDLTDEDCTDEFEIEIFDCSAPCSIDEFMVGTGSNNTVVLGVFNDQIGLQNISISAGDDILWQWVEDSIVGVKSLETSGSDAFDSGLLTNGAIFLSPILSAGIHPYFLYNSSGDTLYEAQIEVFTNCEDNQITVNFSFDDTNGGLQGFNIYVDDTLKVNSLPYQYALNGQNTGVFQLFGDNEEHIITIQDIDNPSCFSSVPFVAPACELPPCGATISISVADTCFNDNTQNYVIKTIHPDPSIQGFLLRVNGELLPGFPFVYDDDGEAFSASTLVADSSVYVFTFEDIFDPSCADTLVYQSNKCVTDCTLNINEAALVDTTFANLHPLTPDSLVGCQDSFVYAFVEFYEKYSDTDTFHVYLDSQYVSSYPYNNGDTLNSFFIKIIGDDKLHTIQVKDNLDDDCFITYDLFTPLCYSPCNIDLAAINGVSCLDQVSLHQAIVDTTTNSLAFDVFIDGEFEASTDTSFQFSVFGDGLNHEVLLVDQVEPLCRDSLSFNSIYCLDCPLDLTYELKDSCLIGDSMTYTVLFPQTLDTTEVEISYDDTSYTVQPMLSDFMIDIRLRGDSSKYVVVFQSLDDIFCKSTLEFQTIDCTPIICEPDFTHTVNGLTVVFTDNSVTSAPIIEQSWTINNIITIGNLSTFNYTVDSIGEYSICHEIITDSCSAVVCKDILVGDPCSLVTPLFSFEKISNGYQFTNLSEGNIDEYLYRFGDGIFSNSENPFHVYEEPGEYIACLRVRQDQFNCEKEYCDTIRFSVGSSDLTSDEKDFIIYPNPTYSSSNQFYIQNLSSNTSIRSIEILDINGKTFNAFEVQPKDKGNYEITMDKRLNPGIYLVRINTDNGLVIKKIVVN